MEERGIEIFEEIWDGIRLKISFERKWLSGLTSHLQVESIKPARTPLPITETGYRSHFCSETELEELGGPVAYVMAWIKAEAETPRWRAGQQARAQLSLF